MRIRIIATALAAAALLAVAAAPSLASPFVAHEPAGALRPGAAGPGYCQAPPSPFDAKGDDGNPVPYGSSYLHCYEPQDIRSWYGVDRVQNQGADQTIVLVDAYGSPTAENDINFFAKSFGGPKPNFTQVCSGSCHSYSSSTSNGQSGPAAAAGWAGEATLDIEWAYAMAPKAHIVLLAVPPAETEGVQGLPNLFKAIDAAIDRYPAGTVFSQSFGITEETFGGAAQSQTAKFDAIYKKGNAKGDTFLASSGDDGTTGTLKQHKDGTTADHPTVGWPASSPYVTAVGGTQLQDGWHWNPTSDIPFTAAGAPRQEYFGSDGTQSSEAAWNESWLPAATGGGPSDIYAKPSWQTVTTAANRYGVQGRGVPDLAWDAAVDGGVLVYTTFYPDTNRQGWHIYGGTSSSSPQVAGVVALANQSRKNAGKGPIGFLNPTIYKTGKSAGAGAAFSDIVEQHYGTADSGDIVDNRLWSYNGDGNAVTRGPIAGWPVKTGWDMTTGFGTPKADGFVAAITAQP